MPDQTYAIRAQRRIAPVAASWLATLFVACCLPLGACVSTEALSPGIDDTDETTDSDGETGRPDTDAAADPDVPDDVADVPDTLVPDSDVPDPDAPDSDADETDGDTAVGPPDDADATPGDTDDDTETDEGASCVDQTGCLATEVCIAGRCRVQVCIPETERCISDTLLATCVAPGLRESISDCTAVPGCSGAGCVCRGDECVRLESCTPGQIRCDGIRVQQCVSDGTRYATTQTCDVERAQLCVDGACGCPSGTLVCENKCSDPLTDSNNCGSCGRTCGVGETCNGGTCGCAADAVRCGETCVRTSEDANNCGSCGTRCGAGQACVGGTCTCAEDEIACGGICADIENDDNNCGRCGVSCGPAQFCVGGRCACDDPGRVACETACIDTFRDPLHCGGCFDACGTGQTCSGGECLCTGGQTNCGGSCTNTRTDANNCGGCGIRCGGGQFCQDNTCREPVCRCGAGQVQCAQLFCDTDAPCCGIIFGFICVPTTEC